MHEAEISLDANRDALISTVCSRSIHQITVWKFPISFAVCVSHWTLYAVHVSCMTRPPQGGGGLWVASAELRGGGEWERREKERVHAHERERESAQTRESIPVGSGGVFLCVCASFCVCLLRNGHILRVHKLLQRSKTVTMMEEEGMRG